MESIEIQDSDQESSNMSVDPGGSGGGGQGSGARKSMAEMSKEELIQKCKGLLNIAQKAKAAKDGKTTSFETEFGIKLCLVFWHLLVELVLFR